MTSSHRSTLLAALAVVTMVLTADVASAQYSRGHYVRREGRHHSVERMHWRNGATPVFGNFGNWIVPLAQTVFGDSDTKSAPEPTKAAPSSLGTCEHYAREQARASDLLVRTAALVNGLPPVQQQDPGVSGGQTVGQRVTEPELQPNPWVVPRPTE